MPRFGGGTTVQVGGIRGQGRDADPRTRRLVRQVSSLKRALTACQAELATAANARTEREAEHWSLTVREVDHRAKNSLQLAASMLIIHGKTTEDAEVRRQLESAAKRLTTLSRLHAVLHEGAVDRGVPLRTWLERVCEGLNMAPEVAIDIVAPEEAWPVEIARPIGLFTFEAVTNALKHGFRDGDGGRIEVSLVRNGAAHRLEVADNGNGIGAAPCMGLGLTLCQIFADQLEGQLTIVCGPNDRGFRTGIDFAGYLGETAARAGSARAIT